MDIQTLQVTTRAASGKEYATKTRAEGKFPAVIYGGDSEPLSIEVNLRQFEALVQHSRGGEHAVIKLEVADKPDAGTIALIKAVQHHPLRGRVLHADFMRVRLDERIETVVPIHLTGQAPGISEGGVLDHQMRELEIECLAVEVPDEFTVDVSGLHIGDAIHVSEVVVPANVTVLSDADRPVVTIHAPRVAKEGEEGAEGGAEPEVIKGGDKEKEKA